MSFHYSKNRTFTLILLWGLILEFPVRYFVSPDPWVHGAGHWYFSQPGRLITELLFVLCSLLPFIFLKRLKDLLTVNWKKNAPYLVYGVIGAIALFAWQQWEEITIIQQNGLGRFIPIWLATGLLIGMGQELTFRGLIYTGIYERSGLKWAVVLSTLCFAFGSIHSIRLYHYLANGYLFETLLLLSVFVLTGLFFVWVRIKTGSIIIPALIHGLGNAITWYSFVIVKLHTP